MSFTDTDFKQSYYTHLVDQEWTGRIDNRYSIYYSFLCSSINVKANRWIDSAQYAVVRLEIYSSALPQAIQLSSLQPNTSLSVSRNRHNSHGTFHAGIDAVGNRTPVIGADASSHSNVYCQHQQGKGGHNLNQ